MSKIINLLGIILPALIIILGIIRVFVKKTTGVNGLTMLFAILLLLTGLVRYFILPGSGGAAGHHAPKPEPLAVSKHSEAFNLSVENMLSSYYEMTEAFVNWDTAAINNAGYQLRQALDSLRMDELQQDTVIYQTALDPYNNAKAELISILSDPSLAEKRGSFNILSDNLRSLLVTIKYDRAKIYWQECPMAFGEEKPGNWLSKTDAVRNPYLGLKDPVYGDKMLSCGGPKDTINFMMSASTK
ncbi:MAG TPA: DUF3347 domain-containing protein [Chitinophagaceae bacterium]|nr:DUF3347 domain-containing protein [Chitinophagaceae bacterium]